MDSVWFACLHNEGFNEREIWQLDQLSYDYSNARIPLTVGESRKKILALCREHPDWTIDEIANKLWKE